MFHKAGITLAGKEIVILGSGGAPGADLWIPYDGAAKITVAARNEKALDYLQERFPYIKTCKLTNVPAGDILVNTTPLGMHPHVGESPVDAAVIRQFKAASDIVYNPLITEF